jgi:cyclic di-GMP phosphodiesterase
MWASYEPPTIRHPGDLMTALATATLAGVARRVPGPRVLVADDDPANRTLLRAMLERAGYEVAVTADGVAALAAARAQPPDLALLDIEMPGRDGIAVTRALREAPATAIVPVILVTGRGEIADKVAGLDAGATDFVTKPFDRTELLARVRASVRMKRAVDRLEDAQGVLVALANAVEAKDPTTEHHCNRLAGLALGLARLCGAPEADIEAVGYGAVLHDVGKIGVPEVILRKPGRLDDAEWAEMRRHPVVGATIVAPLRLGRFVAPIVRAHHERWDGRGYPDGLRGPAIPLGARIVTIVDSFDAMTHDRPYRAGRPVDQALEELQALAGAQFDPELTTLFLDHQAALLSEHGAAPGQANATRGLVAPTPLDAA